MRGGFRDALVLALVAAATTWVALLSWKGFAIDYSGFMGPLIVIGVVVALSGAVLRWLRVPGALLVLAQLVIVGMVVSLYLTGSLVPIGEAWLRLEEAFQDASETARQYAAPVPRSVPPIDPLLIAGGAACMLLVDIMAGTLRRVPLAGLPLLTIYSIPVSLLGGGVSWIIFTLTTIGFLLMLYLQESRQIARWGRPLGNDGVDPSGFGVSNGALRSSAGAIGAAATALAIVVPLFIPTFGIELFGNGFGPGGGDKIKIENPTVDLKRDIQQGSNAPVITIQTNDPNPAYLRISVLNRFSDNEWSPGDRQAPGDQRAIGELPPITGLSSTVPTKEYDYHVNIGQNFDSPWLPTQFPITEIDALGDWRYDSSTMDVMSFDEDLRAGGMSYDMTAVEPELDPEAMNTSPLASDMMGTQLTELPPGLSTSVRTLATRETAEYTGRFQKAVALQNYLRDNGTYELDNSVDGSGSDTLEAFLDEGSPGALTGYCEQFAAAMAVMARTLNIPSRVAIGFLRPTQSAPDTYVYSLQGPARVARAVLPGRRLGAVRAHPIGPSRDGAGVHGVRVPGHARDRPAQQRRFRGRREPAHPRCRPQGAEPPGPGRRHRWWHPVAADRDRRPRRGAARRAGDAAAARPASAARAPADRGPRARVDRVARHGGRPRPHLARRSIAARDRAHLVHYFGRPVGIDTSDRPRHGADVSPEGEVALHRIVSTIEQQR